MKLYRAFILLCAIACLVIIFTGNARANVTVNYFDTGQPVEKYQNILSTSKVDMSSVNAVVFVDFKGDWGQCNKDILGATAFNGYYFDNDISYLMFWMCLYKGKYPKSFSKTATYFHEMGHVYDGTIATNTQRELFKKIMHIKNPLWIDTEDYDGSPNEWFADAFMWCAYKVPREWKKQVSLSIYERFWPTNKQFKSICKKVFNVSL